MIEGTTVETKYGAVDTSKILFICSGAFHSAKPNDLLGELRGRLPLRVNLTELSEEDLRRILTEPQYNLLHQQTKLLEHEDIRLKWDQSAIEEIARLANQFNQSNENIGARRLHTIVEKCVQDISFNCDMYRGQEIVIGAKEVKSTCTDLHQKSDLLQYVF